jgi:hypothetical protein
MHECARNVWSLRELPLTGTLPLCLPLPKGEALRAFSLCDLDVHGRTHAADAGCMRKSGSPRGGLVSFPLETASQDRICSSTITFGSTE